MEEKLRAWGFVRCDDGSGLLEYECDDEYLESLADALGITEDVDSLLIQVDLPDEGMIYVNENGDSWDVPVDEIVEAFQTVFD